MRTRRSIMLSILWTLAASFPLAAGSITGRVVDPAGQGVPGAAVTAFPSDSTVSSVYLKAETGPDGFYTIESVPAGIYVVRAYHSDYATSARRVVVTDDGVTEGTDFQLESVPQPTYLLLTGAVTDARSGVGVPGAVLRFEALRAASEIWARSDPGGGYEVGLEPGAYRLHVAATGYLAYAHPDTIALEAGTDPAALDVALEPAFRQFASLSGVVRSALDTVPVPHPVELVLNARPGPDSAVVGAAVYVVPTEADGSFRFDQVVPATYTLTAWVAGFEPLWQEITLADGEAASLEVLLSPQGPPFPMAGAEGTVRDARQAPIAGAMVEFLGPYPRRPDTSPPEDAVGDTLFPSFVAFTDGDGFYRVEGIPAGQPYAVRASAPLYGAREVTGVVLAEKEIRRLDFTLEKAPAGTVSGRVTYEGSGAAVAGARVALVEPRGTGFETSTDARGAYTVDVPEGTYFAVVYTGFPDSSLAYPEPYPYPYTYWEYYENASSLADARPVEVTDGGAVTGIDFAVPDFTQPVALRVRGTVRDAEGAPLPDAVVHAESFRGYGPAFEARTDAEGRYLLTLDRYLQGVLVWAEHEGHATRFFPDQPAAYLAGPLLFTPDGADLEGIDFTLPPATADGPDARVIQGVVTGPDGEPLAHTLIAVLGAASGQVWYATTDAGGRFSLSVPGDEPYYILFAAEGYAPTFYGGAQLWSEATPADVPASGTDVRVSLDTLKQATGQAAITGRVRAGDAPASGVLMLVLDESRALVAYDFTDAEGVYLVGSLPPGRYTLRADKVRLESASVSLTLAEGDLSRLVDFALEAATPSGNGDDDSGRPARFLLEQNYPNPFNPVTTIRFVLEETSPVMLTVHDALGRTVATLVDGTRQAGAHTLSFDGAGLPTGIYFYRLTAPGQTRVRPMTLIK